MDAGRFKRWNICISACSPGNETGQAKTVAGRKVLEPINKRFLNSRKIHTAKKATVVCQPRRGSTVEAALALAINIQQPTPPTLTAQYFPRDDVTSSAHSPQSVCADKSSAFVSTPTPYLSSPTRIQLTHAIQDLYL